MFNFTLMIVGILIVIGGMIVIKKSRDIAQFVGLIIILSGFIVFIFNLLSIMFTLGT